MQIKTLFTNFLFITLLIALHGCGGSNGDTQANAAPTASNVSIKDVNGDVALVGDSLTGNYTYHDVDGDIEATSMYRWLRNDVAIANATSLSYTLVADDAGQSIRFEVTPIAALGITTGTENTSAAITISVRANSAPTATEVTILDNNGGDYLVGDTLTGNYTYTDVDSDIEGTSTFVWLRNGVAIPNATSSNYVLIAQDAGLPIRFKVTPIATSGITTGMAATSVAITIPMSANRPPTASAVSITDVNGGQLLVGDSLTGSYTYEDVDSDLEGATTFRWLRNGAAITGANSSSYILVAADAGFPITFEVTPVATTGATTGTTVLSAAVIFNEITDNWAQINTGYSHTLAIKKDGSLWAWGNNVFGQLGDGTEVFKTSPVRIGTDNDWVQVAAGDDHSMAIKSNGTLWGWGTSIHGAFGDSTVSQKTNPFKIGIATDWAKVYAARDYTLAIKTDGTLWAWGKNGSGQLGINDTISEQATPTQVGSDNLWTQISLGSTHALGLKKDGTLWAWGSNSNGQLGNGESGKDIKQLSPLKIGVATDWVQVAAGKSTSLSHSLALKSDNTLWGWGNNGFNQLGFVNVAGVSNYLNPVQIGTATDWVTITAGTYGSLAIKKTGTLWAWGWNISHSLGISGLSGSSVQDTPIQVGTANNWSQVSAFSLHAVALKTNGTLSTWGNNYSGELGLGVSAREQNRSAPSAISTLSSVAQIAVGGSHSAAIKTDGTLWTWGQGDFNALGDGTTTTKTNPIQVGQANDWAKVSAGKYSTLAIKSNGTLWAWGSNIYGQLGTADTLSKDSPLQVGSDTKWTQVSTGYTHTLAIKSDGSLWAWGSNSFGKLGDGSTTSSSSPILIGSDNTWVQVAAGYAHSLAIKSNGTLWAWGLNSSGQLGNGNTTNLSSPIQVGTDSNWALVATGDTHTMARKTNGTLWTWGNNKFGQLGNGISGLLNKEISPVQVGTDTTWTQISAGDSHSLALKANGTLWTWGLNSVGQLGNSSNTSSSSPVQVGVMTNWTQVKAGSDSHHSLGLRNDMSIASWGNNRYGQLGLGISGEEQDRKTPTLILP